jgi:predicted HTH transcriptional regulator
MKTTIFISSVQKELQPERRAIKNYVHGDPLLRRFFEVFLFEDLPASDQRADRVYLGEVDRCGVYVGLLGNEYGSEDADGLSPTEREFDRATSKGKIRLIFVKGADDKGRDPKMRALINKAGAQLVRRRFRTPDELLRLLQESLVEHLDGRGIIQDRPFEERPCFDATLNDIDPERVVAFVGRARAERQFPLPERAPMADVLEHLHILHDGRPTMAAVLLFGRDPQRFVPAAEMRCMHFHGTAVQRPAPSYQVFKGVLFEQVDRAVDFVLSVVSRRVGTRALSTQAPVSYDVPPDVVREAIVNAVAHRDYASRASVQVSVFADRVEVSNPGGLPAELTPESLRHPHASIPRNARICDALFLARYIEKFGTGTLMMIDESAAAGLPPPDFEPRDAEFCATVWRDWLTDAVMAQMDLNDRQRAALRHLKVAGQMANTEYQTMLGVAKRTAHRDLTDLVKKGVLDRVGTTGKGTFYVFRKRATKGPEGPSRARSRKGARKGPKGS